MDGTTASEFPAAMVGRTEAYLEVIGECVELLSRLVDSCADGDPSDDVADEIRTLEGDCDARNRELTSLVANATVTELGVDSTRVHLNSEQIVRLYQILDRIPNTAERIAGELVAIRPLGARQFVHRYREMAECATTAVSALRDAVREFVVLLCSSTEAGTIAEQVETVRAAESECDDVRTAVVAEAFRGRAIAHPMLYRGFANRFDRLVDSMEDATDQLVLLSSGEQWITAEPESN